MKPSLLLPVLRKCATGVAPVYLLERQIACMMHSSEPIPQCSAYEPCTFIDAYAMAWPALTCVLTALGITRKQVSYQAMSRLWYRAHA